jgi:hypothetical protein
VAPGSGAVRRALRVAGALVVAVVAALVVVIPARLDAAAVGVAAGTLADARGEAAVLRVSVRLRDVAADTDATVRAAFADTVGADGAGVAVAVAEARSTPPVTLEDGTRTTLLGADALSGDEPASGRWPARADEAVIAAELAERTGLGIGDRLAVRGSALEIVGETAPGATNAPGLRVPPSDGGDEPIGAVIVPDAALLELSPEAWMRWTAVPDAARASPAALAALPAAWRTVGPRLVAAGESDAELSGGLLPTALVAVARADAVAATAPVSVGVAVLMGAVVALAFAQLLLAAREERRAMLWARGASARRLIADAVAEVAVPAAIGAVLGAAVAAGLLVAAGTGPSPSAWALVAAPVGLCAVTAAVAAADARRRERRLGRPAVRRAAVVAALAAYAALAALSCAQLLQYGSLGAGGGRRSVDAVVAAAPALALTALAGGVLALLAALRRPLERIVRRRPRPDALLVVRGAFGRGALSAVPVLVVAVALGHAVFAAGYAATWDRIAAADAAAANGAALRVSQGSGLPDTVLPLVLDTPGVQTAAPVRTRSVSLASASATVLQVSAPAVAALAAMTEQDRARVAAGIRPAEAPGAAATGPVRVEVGGADAGRVARVHAWFVDAYGCLTDTEADVRDGVAAPVAPPGCGPDAQSRLVALDLDAGAVVQDRAALLSAALSIDGEDVSLATWLAGDPDEFGAPAGRADATAIAVGRQRVRLTAPVATPLPAVVSRGFVANTGAEPGGLVSLALTDLTLPSPVEVVDVVDAVPGADDASAAAVDARALIVLALGAGGLPPLASALWVGADDPAATADVLAAGLPSSVVIDGAAVGSARALLAAAPAVVAQGAAASALLALIGVAGVVGARRMRLAAEGAGLRASGAPARLLAALARREVLLLMLAGIAGGAATGFVAAALLAPALAAGAASGSVTAPPDPGAVGAATAIAASVVVAVAAALAAGWGARSGGRR